MGYIAEDELLEVTPDNIRMRKVLLDSGERARDARRRKQMQGGKK